jgi:predicted Zn-dependent peptidase
MCYRVGSRDEEAGTTGYAHLFEHLMYTGTAAVPDWHATMTALGGKTRSQTATEWMVFASDVPRAAAARVIAIEADRMRGLTLDRAAVSRAVADIGNEEAARSAAPLAAADLADLLRPLAFPGHPHARPQKPRTMDPADPDRCRAFYTRHFGPDRALLVVAGGVDPDTVLAAARGTMGHFAPAGATRPPLPALTPLPPLAARRRVEARPGAPTIAVAYRVPRLGEPGFPAAKLVHALLAESTPILGAALADGGPGATWAGIDLDEATGLLTVGARLDPGADPATALDRLGAAVPLVLEASAPQIIATTRDRLRMTEAALTGTVGGRAAAAARDHLAAGAPAPADAAAELAALRASDVTRFAGDHLRADQAVSLILAPAPNSSPASAGAQHSGAPHSGATDPKKDPR